MIRLLGVNLPGNKRIDIGLTRILGIGHARAKIIIREVNVSGSTLCKNLTNEQFACIRIFIEQSFQVEGNLHRRHLQNIKRLMENGSIIGRRHRAGLPVRGQRTRTNARTRKGKIKITTSTKSS